MKRIYLAIFVFFTCFACSPKHDGFTIKGKLIGMDNVSIKLGQTASNDRRTFMSIDSTKVVNGEFTLKGKVENVDMYEVVVADKYNGRVFIENTELEFTIDASNLTEQDWSIDVKSKNSKIQAEYDAITAKAKQEFEDPKYKPLDDIKGLFAIAKKSSKKEDMDKALALQKKLTPLSIERYDRFNKVKFDYIDKNPSSPVSIYLMSFQYSEGRMSREELKKYYHHFKGDAIKTNFYKGYITKVYEDNFIKMSIGSTVPDFTLKSPKEEEITLSTIKGKYILIDFWASWCVPCRASFPALAKLYKEYHKDGFEILGVGTCDKKDLWLKALEQDKTPWLHVFDISNGKGHYGPIATKYGVPYLPTTFLVDADGKIILRNASKEELEAKLKELLGK